MKKGMTKESRRGSDPWGNWRDWHPYTKMGMQSPEKAAAL